VDPRGVTGDPLRNRLKKNLRRLRPWAEREGITCFRVYDRDVPGIPLTIDRYATDDDGEHLHVSVFEPRHGIDRATVNGWTEAAAAELSIPGDRVHVKRRTPGDAYEKQGELGRRLIVGEGGLRFGVNFMDYVDTGLFLDHRITRARVREESAGKRVLNLFAYTGAFSVYAAAGGASRTVSVDLSPAYSRWAEENLARNGFGGSAHTVVVGDVVEWVARQASAARPAPPAGKKSGGELFDLAVIDPPTLSRSKRAAPFEVQRDHERLIAQVLSILAPGGVIWFSTNFQGFALGAVHARVVDEKTAETVPPDFSRRPPIHRSWRIQK
jgi:23S rRNA (cytosine1962-C5)-methyltransferase